MMKKCIFITLLIVLLLSSQAVPVFANYAVIAANKTATSDAEIEKSRILLLERALVPKEPESLFWSWLAGEQREPEPFTRANWENV